MMSDPVVAPLQAGQILGDELEARGWTQADFAAVLGRPTQFVSEIITGKKEIAGNLPRRSAQPSARHRGSGSICKTRTCSTSRQRTRKLSTSSTEYGDVPGSTLSLPSPPW